MAKKVDITLEELLEAGAHFGHQVRRWNPKIAPYLYGKREGIHIFDLAKTREKLLEALSVLEERAKEGDVVLFVGSKRQAREAIKETAKKVGMPYVASRWIGGLLTNFSQIKRSIDKLSKMKASRVAGEYKEYTKKEQLLLEREIARLENLLGGIESLEELPDLLFIVDIHQEDTAVREARRKKIPIVGIVDSNSDPAIIDYPIPMNDDAAQALAFVLDLVGEAVEKGKKAKKK